MGGTDPFDIDTGETRQRALNEHAILADYISIVTVHLGKIAVRLHLAVGHRAVERSERAERIAGEKRSVLLKVCHHGLWPVHHRSQIEFKSLSAEVKHFAILHLHKTGVVEDMVETLYHSDCLHIAYNLYVGICPHHFWNRP